MNISELFTSKTEARDILKDRYNLPKRSKVLIALSFTDSDITNFLLPGLEVLPVNFIIFGKGISTIQAKNITYIDSKENFDMMGVDAIFGNCEDIILEKKMRLGVVPIMNQKNYLGKILSEFQPARGEGNAYLYEDNSPWSAYYALIRYIENHNFPYDNRNLVKNVVGM
ncbi:hypothetical protein LAT59_00475 [Candidatus Gracilibacteria bacterium]|nr:hypothetical protein [Candidatus Gracilibacteria bacterium]